MNRLRVVTTDLATGEVRRAEVPEGEYLIIAVAPCVSEVITEVDGGQVHHVRVSGRRPRARGDLWVPGV